MQQQGQQQRDDAAAGLGDDNAAAARNGRNQEDSRCHQFCQHPNPMGVRFVYAALFLVANVLAWVIRESRVTFYQGQRLNGCHGDRDCLAADAVLVISFASFLLSVIRYITRFNYGWCHIDTGNRYLLVITLSALLYSGSTVGITLMSIWYTASRLNATFIGTTVLLAYLMPLISLKHELRSIVVSEDDVPYGYGFFHFIYATGSMYFGMLFVGWDTHRPLENWNVDVGWTSTWVHFVNEVMAAISFVAILVARVYAIGWLRQLLANIFGIGEQQQPPPPDVEQQQPPRQTILNILSSSDDEDEEDDAVSPPPPLLSSGTSSSTVVVDAARAGSTSHTNVVTPPPGDKHAGAGSSSSSSAQQQLP
ncbi:hypothetical protein HU200_039111 [Digitaria exilis]|uniref:Uncharacterized protein n=1 Tax=Digitaria exilis TaxID=1010633 RepID=A0A835BB96_9POAL|nr:hypothetical protein HU200_039111 [Digitaria exilis]